MTDEDYLKLAAMVDAVTTTRKAHDEAVAALSRFMRGRESTRFVLRGKYYRVWATSGGANFDVSTVAVIPDNA